jgi:hypothetical protein
MMSNFLQSVAGSLVAASIVFAGAALFSPAMRLALA